MITNPTRPKIALLGTFGTGNLGNECTLQAMLHNLRRYVPNADITCICSGPEETASAYHVSVFPIRSALRIREVLGVRPLKENAFVTLLRKAVKLPMEPYRWYKAITMLRGTEMLVMVGLGMLGDFGIRPFGLHYDILGWSIIAKLCGCKLLFVSVGVGPISHPVSRCFVKGALALADYRSYRDTFSKNYLEGIGFNTSNDFVYPDLVFSLPKATLPHNAVRNSEGAVIGVGIMNYYSRRAISMKDDTIYRDYVAKIAEVVTWLLEHNYTVRLLVGDIVYDKAVVRDLKMLLEANGSRYEEEKIIADPACSVDELLSQLAATDVLVASRFHNVLLALMLGKVVVAISYHGKIDALMTGVGLKQFCQDIEHIDLDKVIAQIGTLEREAENLAPGIERQTDTYRLELDVQYDHIFKTVCGPGSVCNRESSAVPIM